MFMNLIIRQREKKVQQKEKFKKTDYDLPKMRPSVEIVIT